MERLAKRQKLIQKKLESLKDRIPIMKSKFPIEDLKLYFKLKNQIPIPNLRKCLAQIHLRPKNPIYNPRIKIQFPIQEYVCLKSLGIYDLAKFLGESAKKIYINKHLIKNYVRKL